MARRTRVGSTTDVQRIGIAIQGPGVDTRIWESTAIVTDVNVDPQNGLFADITLVPTLHTDTARLSTDYAGVGVGIFYPVEVNDEVIVSCPSGDPDEGWVITGRLASASDLPPAGWNNDSVTLYATKPIQFLGATVRLGAPPQASVSVNQPGANNDMADTSIIGTTFRTSQSTMDTSLQTQLTNMQTSLAAMQTGLTALGEALASLGAAFSALSAPLVPLVPLGATFDTAGAGATDAAAGAGDAATAAGALMQAVETFETDASNNNNFLSQSVQIGK